MLPTRTQGGGPGPGPAGWHPHESLLDSCLHNLCNTIAACADFFCCCWFLRDCCAGRLGPLSSPPVLPDPLLGPPPGPYGPRYDFPSGPPAPPGPFGAPLGPPGPASGQPGPSPF